jgi:hypothetical protein
VSCSPFFHGRIFKNIIFSSKRTWRKEKSSFEPSSNRSSTSSPLLLDTDDDLARVIKHSVTENTQTNVEYLVMFDVIIATAD